jgi:deoxyadenosine/deoxycytidine kinase
MSLNISDSDNALNPKKFFIAIIGNLSSGKTEVSQELKERIGKKLWLIPEPVKDWIDCEILQAYYDNPFEMAYPFQQHAFATRMCSYAEIDWTTHDIALSDSHILGDRYVFVDHLRREGKFTEDQVKWYEQYYYKWKIIVPRSDPDLIIYLKTNPQCCNSRMAIRGRSEEEKIPLTYLQGIHDRLEDLIKMNDICERVIIIDGTRKLSCVVDEIEKEIRQFVSIRGYSNF